MRVTQSLWRQHIGRMIKRHWWVASQKTIYPTPAEDILISKNIKVVDAKEVVAPPKPIFERLEILPLFPIPPPLDHTHPDWKEKPRLRYDNESLLLEGTSQAQVLLKTERVNELPEKLNLNENEALSPDIHDLIKRSIFASHIFDAHQEKLPKKKDPLRPAWNFPRSYGIPENRKLHNLMQKLLHFCELMSDPMIGQQRKIITEVAVNTYIERGDSLLYLESSFDTMITSNKLLTPMSDKKEFEEPLPDIYPLEPTISLKPENIYNVQDHYPIAAPSQWVHPHTIVSHFDVTKSHHLTGLPVTDDQVLAISILKSFATAACYAKLKFGEEVMELPEPVTVQCINSNSHWFDFSIFQLNTLDIANDQGIRNIWWSAPRTKLFELAEYKDGRPELEGYNPEVFEKILAFYRNV